MAWMIGSRVGALRWAAAIVLACVAAGAVAKDAAHPLFASADSVTLTVQAPWSEVMRRPRDKDAEPVRHAAVLSYVDASGTERRIEATVERRGLTRQRMCRFPPLRLRFAKAAVQGTLFEGQRSLKMVTHCKAGEVFEQYYVQELLAYRIYNLVTEHSFRARPLSVTYVDSRNGKPDGPRFAFLIEELREVGKRTGLKRSERPRFRPDEFDPLSISRFMLFQLLIGNTDWEVLSGPSPDECCHNVRVVEPRGGGALIAVPYDFDSSGLVDANYAAPHERLPIKDVKERLFRGFCRHDAALEVVRQEFLAHKPAILALVRDDPRLTSKRRTAVNRYLEDFYAMLANEARFAREIRGKCRS